MNDLQIFRNQQLIPLQQNSNGEVIISGRELHEFLEVESKYQDWIKRMIEYGFTKDVDYTSIIEPAQKKEGSRMVTRNLETHILKLDMAKEISMIQRNEKGKQARQYFIAVEKAWNSPEMIMKRALEFANKSVENLKLKNAEQKKQLEEQKPKVLFADAVNTSHTSILVGELAKILKQNKVDMGQNRLFKWLRDNGYLIKRKGTDYNMPTQYSMDLGLFEVKETSITHSDGHISISKTPKVTGKGQMYFINKFIDNQALQEAACSR
ncbi:phage antirepressor KilAC domain-containing protein [Clostridium massiliodielmoense]|uniref:phage antirepressor KilAC domain-containing protein n=1 Tax=Clostridium massiliodielmoense TaxID=1776385 RepID=UPI000A26CB9F|nr:phage antirepressor KilAC domain-containing protein [Clostridium massiliodielmoense]